MISQLQEILSARWLIYRGEVLNYIPLLVSFMNGNKFSAADFEKDKAKNKPYILSALGSIASTAELNDSSLPEGSIAVIPIMGVITADKSIELINNIEAAEENPSIYSIIFMVSSPGGMVFMTDIAAQEIKDCSKPTVAYVMNMAASAAMWLISGCDLIIASSQLDRFGSIGVMTSFTDINSFLKEKLNISIYDLYATKSTRKNEEVRQLLAGDMQPIVDDLDFCNEIFHQAINTNLGIDLKSEVYTGAMFNARKAIDMGLANKIADFQSAIQEAYIMGLKNNINSMINHQ